MDIHKKLALFLVLPLLAGCENTDQQLRTLYGYLKGDVEQLHTEVADHRDEVFRQAQLITQVTDELAKVSDKTLSLRADARLSRAKYSQAQEIDRYIETIKQQLKDLKSRLTVEEFQHTVAHLEQLLQDKESEIGALKDFIRNQDQKIDQQMVQIQQKNEELSRQIATIKQQDAQLNSSVNRQMDMIRAAAQSIENLSDMAPQDLTGPNNKYSVSRFRRKMYKTAIKYYRALVSYGLVSAQKDIDRVVAKEYATIEK